VPLLPFDDIAELGRVPVDLIASHPAHGYTLLPGVLQHLDRLLRLGLKLNLFGYLRLSAPFRIGAPLLGQVEPPIQEGLTFRGGVGQEDANLTILYLARRPRVLPFDAHRLGALLQKAGLIHHADAFFVTEDLHNEPSQLIASLIGIPLRPIQQPLGWVRGLIPNRLGNLPAILALHRSHQPAQVFCRLLTGLTACKQAGKARVKRFKVVGPFVQLFDGHCHMRPPRLWYHHYGREGRSVQVRL